MRFSPLESLVIGLHFEHKMDSVRQSRPEWQNFEKEAISLFTTYIGPEPTAGAIGLKLLPRELQNISRVP